MLVLQRVAQLLFTVMGFRSTSTMTTGEHRLHTTTTAAQPAPTSACSCTSTLSTRKRITGCPRRVRLRSSAACALRCACAAATRARCASAARRASSRSAAAAACETSSNDDKLLSSKPVQQPHGACRQAKRKPR